MKQLKNNQKKLNDKPLCEVYLVLDNIRSAENVGAIFRTCDAVGVNKVYLCGITPRPPRSDIKKAALAAYDSINWEYHEDAIDIINKLKANGVKVVALEQSDISVNYRDIKLKENIAIVVGNEVDGVNSEILEVADEMVELPMFGKCKSLNVATSTGILLYSLLNYEN